MHSHGANHCSLEKFPDEIKTIRVMSDSDLFKNLDHVSRGGKKTIDSVDWWDVSQARRRGGRR